MFYSDVLESDFRCGLLDEVLDVFRSHSRIKSPCDDAKEYSRSCVSLSSACEYFLYPSVALEAKKETKGAPWTEVVFLAFFFYILTKRR